MKRTFFLTLSALLIIGSALIWLGNYQNAPAVSAKTTDLTTLDAADISAYRWEAMAKYYEGSSVKDLTTLSAAEISAYRWEAMAKYYEGSSARDLTTLDAADISAYRWEAMAKYYMSHQSSAAIE
jgi:hypothetical protein